MSWFQSNKGDKMGFSFLPFFYSSLSPSLWKNLWKRERRGMAVTKYLVRQSSRACGRKPARLTQGSQGSLQLGLPGFLQPETSVAGEQVPSRSCPASDRINYKSDWGTPYWPDKNSLRTAPQTKTFPPHSLLLSLFSWASDSAHAQKAVSAYASPLILDRTFHSKSPVRLVLSSHLLLWRMWIRSDFASITTHQYCVLMIVSCVCLEGQQRTRASHLTQHLQMWWGLFKALENWKGVRQKEKGEKGSTKRRKVDPGKGDP